MPRRRLGRKQQVGYGNPPIETRWKPGQSGNPAGRRKGSKDIRAAISAILTDKITLREGDKVRSVTRLEAVMLKQMQKALNGDSRAIQAVYAAANALGLLQPRPQQLVLGELGAFTKEELIEFERLLLKASARVIPK
jgi:hypothetical protein